MFQMNPQGRIAVSLILQVLHLVAQENRKLKKFIFKIEFIYLRFIETRFFKII